MVIVLFRQSNARRLAMSMWAPTVCLMRPLFCSKAAGMVLVGFELLPKLALFDGFQISQEAVYQPSQWDVLQQMHHLTPRDVEWVRCLGTFRNTYSTVSALII